MKKLLLFALIVTSGLQAGYLRNRLHALVGNREEIAYRNIALTHLAEHNQCRQMTGDEVRWYTKELKTLHTLAKEASVKWPVFGYSKKSHFVFTQSLMQAMAQEFRKSAHANGREYRACSIMAEEIEKLVNQEPTKAVI